MPTITFTVTTQTYQRLGKVFGDGYQPFINNPVSGLIANPQPLTAFAESQLKQHVAEYVQQWELNQNQNNAIALYNQTLASYSSTAISVS